MQRLTQIGAVTLSWESVPPKAKNKAPLLPDQAQSLFGKAAITSRKSS